MVRRGLWLALLTAVPVLTGATRVEAEIVQESPSIDVRRLAGWVIEQADTRGLPFLIVDKIHARVFAFDALGVERGAAPVLLGMSVGDVSPPRIGTRRLADIAPEQRITPAGRFEAHLGRDLTSDVLWIDYEAAVSLHRVVKGTPAERRADRLMTPTARDNRISYGCINVPADFYDTTVQPLFQPANGIVYIIPESAHGRSVWPVK